MKEERVKLNCYKTALSLTAISNYFIISVGQIVPENKAMPFELICAVYLEYIVTINFDRPYPN